MIKTYAQINDLNIVEVVSITESIIEDPKVILVQGQSVSPGDIYNPETGTFTTPPPVVVPIRILTKYQFRKRFTLEELVRMDNLSTFVSLTPQQAAYYNTFQKDYDAATEIDLDNADVLSGLTLLVQLGVITESRKQEILG